MVQCKDGPPAKKTPGHALCDVKVEEHAILPLWNQRNIDDENEEDESE